MTALEVRISSLEGRNNELERRTSHRLCYGHREYYSTPMTPTPRWVGWVLVVSGTLLAILMTFLVVVFALFGDGWEAEDAYLFLFLLFGLAGVMAGIRILRGTSVAGSSSN